MKTSDNRPRDAAHNALVEKLWRQCVYNPHLYIPNAAAIDVLAGLLSVALHRFKAQFPEPVKPSGDPLKPGDFVPDVKVSWPDLQARPAFKPTPASLRGVTWGGYVEDGDEEPAAAERLVPRWHTGGVVRYPERLSAFIGAELAAERYARYSFDHLRLDLASMPDATFTAYRSRSGRWFMCRDAVRLEAFSGVLLQPRHRGYPS